MDTNTILVGLAGVLALAAPILFAVIGETITERAGIINLSLNGTILLSAIGGFAVACETGSLLLGFLMGMLVGALVALIVAFSSITLRQSQVAVGFVLALLGRDLSYFLGTPYMNISGPRLAALPIPFLKDIPVLGPLFFRQDVLTYLSFAIIFLVWLWIFRTRPGLMLRGIGERPAAAFVRGANVNLMRYVYTIIGGAVIGLAGPAYSLNVKAGWMGYQSGLDGFGWIALSITIFGGWNPLRAAFGAYLFSLLQWLGLVLQPVLPGIPSQVLQVAPFPLMILTLLLVNISNAEWVERMLAAMPEGLRHVTTRLLRAMRASPPASLGVPFESE
ncbi:MAG: simple sugar transport system permease protein [Anaerolineaceae bacterium]|nr:MAG: simple sugar transport system permease protein [Anaerolineaceae bacterium]